MSTHIIPPLAGRLRCVLFSTPILAFGLCAFVPLSGMAQNSPSPSPNAADQAWNNLIFLQAGGAGPKKGSHTPPGQGAAIHEQQALRARSAAAAAKDFYTRFPSDARAPQARKAEAIAALRGVLPGDIAQEAQAVATARAVRNDNNMPAKDRFDVAVAMDTQTMAPTVKTGPRSAKAAEQKELIENWRTEFGALTEIDAYATVAARHADPRYATQIATGVLNSASATVAQRKEVTFIKERARLLGQPLGINLPLFEGGNINLGAPSGHTTIVVLWSPSRPQTLDPLKEFARPFSRNAQVVCLALGGKTSDVARVRHSLPVVKEFSNVPLGPEANQIANALKLQLVPYVYVVNGAGVLTDFGPLGELPALLLRAGLVKTQTL